MGIVSAVNRAAYFYGFIVIVRPGYSAFEGRIEFATKTGKWKESRAVYLCRVVCVMSRFKLII